MNHKETDKKDYWPVLLILVILVLGFTFINRTINTGSEEESSKYKFNRVYDFNGRKFKVDRAIVPLFKLDDMVLVSDQPISYKEWSVVESIQGVSPRWENLDKGTERIRLEVNDEFYSDDAVLQDLMRALQRYAYGISLDQIETTSKDSHQYKSGSTIERSLDSISLKLFKKE